MSFSGLLKYYCEATGVQKYQTLLAEHFKLLAEMLFHAIQFAILKRNGGEAVLLEKVTLD